MLFLLLQIISYIIYTQVVISDANKKMNCLNILQQNLGKIKLRYERNCIIFFGHHTY